MQLHETTSPSRRPPPSSMRIPMRSHVPSRFVVTGLPDRLCSAAWGWSCGAERGLGVAIGFLMDASTGRSACSGAVFAPWFSHARCGGGRTSRKGRPARPRWGPSAGCRSRCSRSAQRPGGPARPRRPPSSTSSRRPRAPGRCAVEADRPVSVLVGSDPCVDGCRDSTSIRPTSGRWIDASTTRWSGESSSVRCSTRASRARSELVVHRPQDVSATLIPAVPRALAMSSNPRPPQQETRRAWWRGGAVRCPWPLAPGPWPDSIRPGFPELGGEDRARPPGCP